jgi:hypothetical protein
MIQSTVSTPCYSTHTARTVADPTLSETLQGDILIRIQKERNIHCGAKHWSMEDVGGTAQAGIIYLPPTDLGTLSLSITKPLSTVASSVISCAHSNLNHYFPRFSTWHHLQAHSSDRMLCLDIVCTPEVHVLGVWAPV